MNSWQLPSRGEQRWNWKWDHNRNKVSTRGMWRPMRQTKVTRMSGEFTQWNKTAKVIQVEKVQDNLEWLDRSLLCISDAPRDIDKIKTMICNTFPEVILVRDLGKFKFLLTMDSKESKERLKNEETDRLKQWFSLINDWAEEDVCQTRRLWLEIVGVPIQIWSEQNIRKIAENWGDVVFVDKSTAAQESFASAKVVIDTLSVNPIEDEAIIQVEGKGFRVSVFEAKTEFTIIHMGPIEEEISDPSRGTTNACKVAVDSSDVAINIVNQDHDDRQKEQDHVGEEGEREDEQSPAAGCNSILNSNHTNDVSQPRDSPFGSINSVGEVEKNSKLCNEGLEDARSEGVVGEAPLFEGEDEEGNGQLAGLRVSNDALSDYSSTKTKSAQLSGNGFSEEMEKIFRLKQVNKAEFYQQSIIGNGIQVNELRADPQESDLSIPPGFGIAEDAVPPGFLTTIVPEANQARKLKGKRRIIVHSAKRMTRSQVKQSKKNEAPNSKENDSQPG